MEGYDMFYNELDKGRGVIIYTQTNLHAEIEDTITGSYNEMIWCKLSIKQGMEIIVGCIYRSPSSSFDNSSNLNHVLKEITLRYPQVLIVGDFNYRDIDWEKETPNTQPGSPCYEFLECVKDCYLIQHVNDYTRYRHHETPSILDLVFTKNEEDINDILVMEPLGKSDHVSLKISLNLNIPKNSTTETIKYRYYRGNYEDMKQEITKKMNELEE
ncbi:hypothetical protein SNE40_001352 [Patella caerulea]|uniref:Endonuclease/exonuclease/phosphatase domain-containing protein n=1 Tax=Patella caerulea TaxID=87958 RepID=A0AAN8KFS4_PATCE